MACRKLCWLTERTMSSSDAEGSSKSRNTHAGVSACQMSVYPDDEHVMHLAEFDVVIRKSKS
jgi:hypothetical protein